MYLLDWFAWCRIRSACVTVQSGQSIRCTCTHEEVLHPWLYKIRHVKIQIRLHECAGWSEFSLCALCVQRYVFWRCGSNTLYEKAFFLMQTVNIWAKVCSCKRKINGFYHPFRHVCHILSSRHLCCSVWKRTFGHVRPAKIQIRLRIGAVWSESSLGA